jgi:hypothetical protein
MPRCKKLFYSKKEDYGKNKMAKSEQLSVIIQVRLAFFISAGCLKTYKTHLNYYILCQEVDLDSRRNFQ